ncbi:3700_t:CDS:2 [Racocetra persica]|uniref:3700_t:CDS:1 n=1 Tax=Racocetra persica TaxID=160502 RepID=A0ACA9MRD6_9GLOM|nr:3700_t:CDS:2 [Racocetra persica]
MRQEQVKNKAEKYKVGSKDIQEFSAVLAKQAKDTIGFFVTNSTYSINTRNETKNKELQKNLFELNDLVIKDLEIDSNESTVYLFGIKIDRKCRIGSMQIKDNFIKKLIDNINNNKEYSLKQEYLSEYHQIKIESKYNNISKNVENEYVYKIKQETLRRLKRKYPNKVVRRKRIKTKEPKIIVLMEAIGVEKSTFREKFKSYLEEKEYKVYQPVEASLLLNDELKLFCKDSKNNALFF